MQSTQVLDTKTLIKVVFDTINFLLVGSCDQDIINIHCNNNNVSAGFVEKKGVVILRLLIAQAEKSGAEFLGPPASLL